ncbi:unnamed protein product [Allacma fusca]|uniref:Secreted protein n=1 Tax=Allacma fusca TaxID=39272 RepID=A0A8J2KIW3_9HEXA|nr:unnamed protein product [Allacma fusca]
MIHCIRHFWTSWAVILFLIAVSTDAVTSEVPNEGLNSDGEVLLQREGRHRHYGHHHHRYRPGGFRRDGLIVTKIVKVIVI